MSHVSDRSIDVIVTSPPYNIGKSYASGVKRYDDRKPHNRYLEFLFHVFSECFRVLKEDGVFFLNIGDSARDQGKSEDVVRKACEAGFIRLQTIIWVKSIFGKGHYTPSGKNRRLNNLWEFIFVLVKGPIYRFNPLAVGIPYVDKSNVGRYAKEDLRDAGDIWFIPYPITTGAKIKKGHEAPFPIELPYRCIMLVPQAKRVLDPFAGSGSTLTAAEMLGMKGIGYEPLPNEQIIREKILTKFSQPPPPLLPQLEVYANTLARFWKAAKQRLSDGEVNTIISSLTARELKQYKWACKDLGIDEDESGS